MGAKLEGQGTGEALIVSMCDEDAESNIIVAMLEVYYSHFSHLLIQCHFHLVLYR